MLKAEMYLHKIDNDKHEELLHWKNMLSALEQQLKEFSVKKSTDANKKFYAKLIDETAKTKSYVAELEKNIATL